MKKRYVVSMNLSGLYSYKVTECFWNKTESGYGGGWWDKTGDMDGPKIGLSDTGVIVKFVTSNKHDAEMYLKGIKTALKQIERYCNSWGDE